MHYTKKSSRPAVRLNKMNQTGLVTGFSRVEKANIVEIATRLMKVRSKIKDKIILGRER